MLGAVLGSRFAALLPPGTASGADSLPAALATAGDDAERAAVTDALAAGVGSGQRAGAAAVFCGGWTAALLLRSAAQPRPAVDGR